MKLSSMALAAASLTTGLRLESNAFPGVFFHVRTTEYGPYKQARDLKLTQLSRLAGGKEIDPILRDGEIAKLAAEHLITGWEGITDDAGDPIPFTVAQATEILTAPDYTPLKNSIWRAISEAGEAQVAAADAFEKN